MKKKLGKKVMATSEPHPAKSYFLANGRFSYSGSHIVSQLRPMHIDAGHSEGVVRGKKRWFLYQVVCA